MYDFEKQMNDIKKIAIQKKITLKNPTLWGNTTWLLLHLISLEISNVSSKEMLIETILHSLPCRICKKACHPIYHQISITDESRHDGLSQ